MKTSSILCAFVLFTFAAVACAQDEPGQDLAKPESLDDRASYSFGLNLGRNFEQQGVPINLDYLIQGMRDGLEGGEALLTDEEMNTTMQAFQQEMMARAQKEREESASKNQTAADEFLASNKTAEGVVTTESGLQYQVIEAGSGPKPGPTDQVTVHYKGTLLDGTVFDSSYDRNQPASFPVNGVIPGWGEAVQLMPVGSKWKLWIPPTLAYGERGAGNQIGPNALLVFEVELLSIGEPPAADDDEGGELEQ